MAEINNAWMVQRQTPEGGWVSTHWLPMEIIVTINGDIVPEENKFDMGEARAALLVQQMKAQDPSRSARYVKVHDSNVPNLDTRSVYITETYGSFQ